MNSKQRFGKTSESTAVSLLSEKGYQVLQQNYRTQFGEIDIIAKHGQTIVFIEVKARRTTNYGHPKSAVTDLKQKKISKAAMHYLKTTGQIQHKARFDVLTIQEINGKSEIRIIQNAFDIKYE